MPNYSPEIRNQAKKLFVEDSKTPAEIAELLNVSRNTIYNWRDKSDSKGKNWKDYRNDKIESNYKKLSKEAIASLILNQIENLAKSNDPNTADKLSKLYKIYEGFTQPKNQIIVFDFLEDFLNFIKSKSPETLSNEFIALTTEYKNEKLRLISS